MRQAVSHLWRYVHTPARGQPGARVGNHQKPARTGQARVGLNAPNRSICDVWAGPGRDLGGGVGGEDGDWSWGARLATRHAG